MRRPSRARSRAALALVAAATLALAAGRARGLGLEAAGALDPSELDVAMLAPAAGFYDGNHGHLLVASPILQQIAVMDREGQLLYVLQSDDLQLPAAVAAANDGALYVADAREDRVAIVTRTADKKVVVAELNLAPYRRGGPVVPTALHVDARGTLFVADRRGRQVLVFDRDRRFVRAVRDVGDPGDVFVDRSSRLYVADCGSAGGVRVYDDGGQPVRTLGIDPSRFSEPLQARAIAVDSRGRIWALDDARQLITAIDLHDNALFTMGTADLAGPVDLAIDRHDRLYVVEQSGNRASGFKIIGF